jgi:hypothetical protein
MDLEMLALSERLGDEPLAAHAMGRVFWGAIEAGDATLADSTLMAFERLAERLRLPHHELVARAARCVRDVMQGNFEAAERHIAHIDATRERWRPALAATLPLEPAMMLRACLATARGDRFDLSILSPDALAEAPRDVITMMKVHIDARAGRVEDAAAAFGASAERFLTPGCPYMARFFLGDACARIRAREYADKLYDLCLPFEGRHVVMTPFPGYDGAMDRLLGALASVRGDHALARRHYDAAIAMEERLGATAFVARSRAERDALAPASTRAAAPAPTARPDVPSFVREGEIWLVSFGSESARIKDADGLRYLAYLVARPDVAVPVNELFAERARAGGDAAPSGDAGEVLDREAVASYRERARELRESLDDAEARHDQGAAERSRNELAFLEQELSRAVGLGGRPRRAASDHERIRVNVTTRIRKSIDKLDAHVPRLARHLSASIKTGSLCTYQPP